MSDTPRTDAAEIISMHPNDLLGWPEGRKTGVVPKSKMKELERELASVTEQRDRLAEALEYVVDDLDVETRGRIGNSGKWCSLITAREALAAAKGGDDV